MNRSPCTLVAKFCKVSVGLFSSLSWSQERFIWCLSLSSSGSWGFFFQFTKLPPIFFARPEATEMLRYEVSVSDQLTRVCWACYNLVGETRDMAWFGSKPSIPWMVGPQMAPKKRFFFVFWRQRTTYIFQVLKSLTDSWSMKKKTKESKILNFIKQALVEKNKILPSRDNGVYP